MVTAGLKLASGCHFDAIVNKKLAAKPSRGTEDKESRYSESNSFVSLIFKVGLKHSRPDFFGGLDLDLQRPLQKSRALSRVELPETAEVVRRVVQVLQVVVGHRKVEQLFGVLGFRAAAKLLRFQRQLVSEDDVEGGRQVVGEERPVLFPELGQIGVGGSRFSALFEAFLESSEESVLQGFEDVVAVGGSRSDVAHFSLEFKSRSSRHDDETRQGS